MRLSIPLLLLSVCSFFYQPVAGQVDRSDWEGGFPDGCTSITVGKMASADGSVMTSHTDDSHRTRSWMDVQPAKQHERGAVSTMYKRLANAD